MQRNGPVAKPNEENWDPIIISTGTRPQGSKDPSRLGCTPDSITGTEYNTPFCQAEWHDYAPAL